MGPFHWRNRILRIPEIKRLQTFPDDFALAGTVEQQWRQIGNAVPPLLAYQMALAIKECYNSEVVCTANEVLESNQQANNVLTLF